MGTELRTKSIARPSAAETLEKIGRDPAFSEKLKESDLKGGPDYGTAASLLDLGDQGDLGRTTVSDFYALNRILQPENRLTINEFWGLASDFEKKFTSLTCREKPRHRFLSFPEKEILNSGNFLPRIQEESKTNPVLLYFTADWCAACRDIAWNMRNILENPALSGYFADMTKPDSLQKLYKEAGLPPLPFALLYVDGKLKFRGDARDLKTSDAFEEVVFQEKQSLKQTDQDMAFLAGSDWKKYRTGVLEIVNLPYENPLHGVLDSLIKEKADDLRLCDSTDRTRQEKIYGDLEFYMHSFKSAHAFSDLGRVAFDNTDAVQQRSLTVLVPGSGHLVSPLVTAMYLIGENEIDEAHYIFTEIDKKTVDKVMQALDFWATQKSQMSKPEIIYDGLGNYGGRKATILVYWNGAPITIDIKIKDSPQDKFFSPEDGVEADILVYHDVGIYNNTPDDIKILPDALKLAFLDRGVCNTKRRILTLNEFGHFGPGFYFNIFYRGELQGNYGHAGPVKIQGLQDTRPSTHWDELSETPMKGMWMPISGQPLLEVLESREEIEHLVDLGIAAADIVRDDPKTEPVYFHIRDGDMTVDDLNSLFEFGYDLNSRLTDDKAAEGVRLLMLRTLTTALKEGGRMRAWAEDQIRHLGTLDFSKDKGWLDTLWAVKLVDSHGRVLPVSAWSRSIDKLRSDIDIGLVFPE